MEPNKSNLRNFFNKKRLKNLSFCIVANDCWGAEVYQYFNLQYNTPFVGLYLMAPCYMKLLQNFETNIYRELTFVPVSKYKEVNDYKKKLQRGFPTGLLGRDIEIQFLHYQNNEEAKDKWQRRVDRMNLKNLFFKFDASKDAATPELVQQFDSLAYNHKLCLTKQPDTSASCMVYCSDWEMDGAKMFQKSIRHFSITRWLNGKGLRKPFLWE